MGPLIYSVLHKCSHWEMHKPLAIVILLVFCSVCTGLLCFFWQWTAFIFGNERSVALLILMFGMAMVNATSNVLFMPYMACLNVSYLSAYFVGMGLSALVPSLVALAQGLILIYSLQA